MSRSSVRFGSGFGFARLSGSWVVGLRRGGRFALGLGLFARSRFGALPPNRTPASSARWRLRPGTLRGTPARAGGRQRASRPGPSPLALRPASCAPRVSWRPRSDRRVPTRFRAAALRPVPFRRPCVPAIVRRCEANAAKQTCPLHRGYQTQCLEPVILRSPGLFGPVAGGGTPGGLFCRWPLACTAEPFSSGGPDAQSMFLLWRAAGSHSATSAFRLSPKTGQTITGRVGGSSIKHEFKSVYEE